MNSPVSKFMTMARVLPFLLIAYAVAPGQTRAAGESGPGSRSAVVSIRDGRWWIGDRITNPQSAAEGLLMNVRMVNATFEDRRKPDFDPEENTDRFLARIGDYAAHGVNAFTLCLQGGMPGYEGALNSAFEADGSLRADYLRRVERVIRACDQQGVAVILGLYYQRQSHILRDEEAIRTGVVNAAKWIRERGFSNVLLEIANEYPHKGFVHPVIRDPKGQASLIRLAKASAPGLLVTASGYGNGTIHPEVAEACDFLTPHWNGTNVEAIPARLKSLRRFGKPIVVNEDDKTGERAVAALRASVANGAAYGLMLKQRNQTVPFRFDGAADDPEFYAALKLITTPGKAAAPEAKKSGYFPPPDSEGGWRASENADETRRVARMNAAKLEEAFSFIQGTTGNGGLLVLRHGWLVYERYFGRGHRDATPNLGSCGKSFTSIAVGILMSERPELFPEGLDQEVFTPRYFPAAAFPLSDPRKAQIKLGQLLAFTAGIRGNTPGYVQGREVSLDPPGPDGWTALVDDFAFGRKDPRSQGPQTSTRTLWCDPGEGYSYATASIHLASVMLRHVTGRELQDYLEEHLAQPLGWGRWGFGYRNHPEITHTPGGGGIALRGTDMLRFGYLLLREGRWGDRQIIPAEYVRHCASTSPYNPHFPYSLQFNVNSGGEIPDLPRDAYWKTGSGGHALYIVPSLDLVVWKLGGRDAQYLPSDTGLPLPAGAVPATQSQTARAQTVPAQDAVPETLKQVIAAIEIQPLKRAAPAPTVRNRVDSDR